METRKLQKIKKGHRVRALLLKQDHTKRNNKEEWIRFFVQLYRKQSIRKWMRIRFIFYKQVSLFSSVTVLMCERENFLTGLRTFVLFSQIRGSIWEITRIELFQDFSIYCYIMLHRNDTQRYLPFCKIA
jgi:hypothetical protein